jgi:hypothetical protein
VRVRETLDERQIRRKRIWETEKWALCRKTVRVFMWSLCSQPKDSTQESARPTSSVV